MNKTLCTTLAIGGLLLATVGAANANLLTNGSFENGAYNGGGPGSFRTLYAPNNTSITGWSIIGGTIDWINGYWTAFDGNKSLDMSGLSQGTIRTTFATTPGATYNVSFEMAGNPDSGPKVKTLQAWIDTQIPHQFAFNTTGKTRNIMGWALDSFSFVANKSMTTLTFQDLSVNPGGNYYGAALDNVMVTAAPVPEPATLLLFGTGIISLASALRRKTL